MAAALRRLFTRRSRGRPVTEFSVVSDRGCPCTNPDENQFPVLFYDALPLLKTLHSVKHILNEEECTSVGKAGFWWDELAVVIVVKGAVQDTMGVLEKYKRDGWYDITAKSIEMLSQLYREKLVTEDEVKRMKGERGSLSDRVVRVQFTKAPEVVARTVNVLDKYGHNWATSLLRALNELFTRHLLTAEECSEVARKGRWEWEDHLTQVLLTKPAEVVEETCKVLEKHGCPVEEELKNSPQSDDAILSEKVYDHPRHLMLFRRHISRRAAGNGRAILEGVGLDAPTIAACFTAHPSNEEEVVQEGLTKWCGGKGVQPPTWRVLIEAIAFAEIAQQDIEALKKELSADLAFNEDISHTGASTVDSGRDPVLSQNVYDRTDYLKLFRTFVSRNAATKGRAVLEGVELRIETIDACFSSHPLDEEEAVQAGLTRWSGGQGRQPPTWEVLISAMEYAKIAQQHIEDLRKELHTQLRAEGTVCTD